MDINLSDDRLLTYAFARDNALLAHTYLDGYLASGEAEFARITRETLDYVCCA